MKKIIIAIALFVGFSSVQAASFDCKKASTSVEMTICSDPTISKMDENIDYLFKQAKKTTKSVDALVASQRMWIKERNKATSVEALEALHIERQEQLLVIANPAAKAGPKAMERKPQPMQRQAAEMEDYEMARLERMALEDGKIDMSETTVQVTINAVPVSREYDMTAEEWEETFMEMYRHDAIMDDEGNQLSSSQVKPKGLNDYSIQCLREVTAIEVAEFAKSAQNAGVMKNFNKYREQLHTVRINMGVNTWIAENGAMQINKIGCDAMKVTVHAILKSTV